MEKKPCYFLISFFIIFTVVTNISYADVVYLKNGKRVEGNIYREDENKLWLEIYSGINVGIQRSEIEKIERKEVKEDNLKKEGYPFKSETKRIDDKGNNVQTAENEKWYPEWEYTSGKKDGVYKVYNQYSKIISEEISYRGGKKNGITRYYNDRGELQCEINYKDGKADGVSKYFYSNGEVESEGTYKDDKQEGKFTSYYQNGKLRDETFYQGGKLARFGKRCLESGNLISEDNRDENGTGIRTSYWGNGNLAKKAYYKLGKRDGPLRKYYENGELYLDANYKDDVLDGILKVYYENGNLMIEANFENKKLMIARSFDNFGIPDTNHSPAIARLKIGKILNRIQDDN